MATKKLFGNMRLLDEVPATKDIFNLKDLTTSIKARLARQVTAKRSSIIPILGPFGSGKSTIINQVQSECPRYTWLNFESWRFSNRQDIWDGFVIQLAAKLESKKEAEIADEIDGITSVERSVKAQVSIIVVSLVLSIVISLLMWSWLQGSSELDNFSRAYLKFGFPVFVTIGFFGSLGVFVYKTRSSKESKPIHRVFELETILIRALKKTTTPIIIVAEDIDRAGNEGVIFLETLISFMRVHYDDEPFDTSLLVLAPQTKDAFDALEHGGVNGFERSLKIYDEPIYVPSTWNRQRIETLYDALKTHGQYKDDLINATEILTNSYGGSISFRLLKYALREVAAFQELYPTAKPEISLAVILSRYIVTYNKAVAQTKLFSGELYNSGSIGGFIKAIIVSKGTSPGGGGYSLHLKDNLEDEVAFEVGSPQPNGSVDTVIDIDSKYSRLMTP